MKKITILIITVFSINIAISQEVDGINYTFSGVNATVVAITGCYTGTVTIPEMVTFNSVTYTVTSIGNSAFENCGVNVVTLPNSVLTIGDFAFRGTALLFSITIGDSVTSIGDFAFSNNTSLNSITLPNSLISIGNSAFLANSSFFNFTIPNSVTSIGDSAFQACTSLSNIIIGDSVTSIGFGAFMDCSSLGTIAIPASVTSIGDFSFDGCIGLNDFTALPIVPIAINSNVFSGVPIQFKPLSVPMESLAAYQAAAVWQNFNPINGILSITENNIEIDVSVFPNPTESIFSIKTNATITSLKLYDFFGKLVRVFQYQERYDVSNLSSGIYIIEVNGENGNSAFKKIVKY